MSATSLTTPSQTIRFLSGRGKHTPDDIYDIILPSRMAENSSNTIDTAKAKRKTLPCPHCMNQGIEYLSTCQFNLDQHIREKHTLDRPYPCSFCHKSFPRVWSKNRHETEVHGVQRPGTKAGKSRLTAYDAKMAEQRAQRGSHPAPGPTASGEASSAIDPNLSNAVYPSSWVANATPEGPPFRCLVHGVTFANIGEWMMHGHAKHNVMYSVTCPCEICQTVVRSPNLSA